MDTLTLAENDKRIVLLQNGQWVYVQEDGTLLAPDSREKLVLEANGTWSVIPLRGHTILHLRIHIADADDFLRGLRHNRKIRLQRQPVRRRQRRRNITPSNRAIRSIASHAITTPRSMHSAA